MQPTDVGDAGRMAVFTDPEGAQFSVWQARRHRGATVVNEPGR
jgi:predicted enzyme related to lactoylglutathione lyase